MQNERKRYQPRVTTTVTKGKKAPILPRKEFSALSPGSQKLCPTYIRMLCVLSQHE